MSVSSLPEHIDVHIRGAYRRYLITLSGTVLFLHDEIQLVFSPEHLTAHANPLRCTNKHVPRPMTLNPREHLCRLNRRMYSAITHMDTHLSVHFPLPTTDPLGRTFRKNRHVQAREFAIRFCQEAGIQSTVITIEEPTQQKQQIAHRQNTGHPPTAM